jgi:3-hydroxyacyl-CoA dehydrogenase
MGTINAFVDLRNDDGIAVVTIDNPPVNATRQEVRAGLFAALSSVRDDPQVKAAVIVAAGRTFIAGADITEFGKPPVPPSNRDVIALMESLEKPVVAAMHGTVLGGGLELALGCHYRIARGGTRLGLPEVKLGIIPGAGGTQRLPRLVGVTRALAMIASGEPIKAEEALELGLIDAVVTGDLAREGVAFARTKIGAPRRRVRDQNDKVAAMAAQPDRYEAEAAGILKRARGQEAIAAAVEAVRWSFTLPIDEALRREQERFAALRDGEQSKAQRYAFFAEREAAKIPDLPKDVKPREVKRAAVVGAGTMGSGIAMCFASAGIPVSLIDTDDETVRRGLDAIAKNYRATAARGGISQGEADERIARIAGATDLASVGGADLVVEAVFEDLEVKRRVFADLDRLAKGDAILATNTSYLDPGALAAMTRRPDAVLGMHFFSPANVMRLVELVRTPKTSHATLATASALARRLGKVPVTVGVCHGFVGNRMLRLRSAGAERLLVEGALPRDVDAAMVAFGFPMGPFAAADLAGLDISWRMRKAQGLTAEIADALCEAGRFGQKTGAGFYRYEAGARTPLPDPEVERIIVAASARLGLARRPIAAAEIVERLIFPMINEGARIIEEGIAARASDIDVVWLTGYGWPAWRGGPMYHADATGLAYIRDRLAGLAQASGDPKLAPAALLRALAASGGKLSAAKAPA